MADQRTVLRNVDGDYLFDYALFTGALREYVMHTLEGVFKQDHNSFHRRLYILNLYREEYFAYEDLGAMLAALLVHQANPEIPVLETLLRYGPGTVKLAKLFEVHGVTSATQLHAALALDALIPDQWAKQFSDTDLPKALRVMTRFFFDECSKNQQPDGVKAFNKLKHGLLVVPDGRRYLSSQTVDGPAAIFANDDTATNDINPMCLYTVPMNDEALEQRARSMHFIQANLRLLAALRVVAKHPEVVKKRLNASRPELLFRHQHLTDVVQLVQNVTKGSPD